MRLVAWIFYGIVCVGIGWIVGSKHAAPPIILEATDRVILATKDRISDALEGYEAGGATVKEITEETGVVPAPLKTEKEMLPAHALAGMVELCRTSISNAPAIDQHGHVTSYKQLVDINGVTFAMMPVKAACISSGFGRRKGKLHKGVDYYSKKGGAIFAAADGQVVEAEYRDDYGFTVLLNHGNGYFTRYAHLKEFSAGVKVGVAVPLGYELGPMGQTAGFAVPKHLHFEVLKGNYDTPKKSFGLTPVDIYNLP